MDVILKGLGDVVVHHIGHVFDVKAWPSEMVDELYKFDVGIYPCIVLASFI